MSKEEKAKPVETAPAAPSVEVQLAAALAELEALRAKAAPAPVVVKKEPTKMALKDGTVREDH